MEPNVVFRGRPVASVSDGRRSLLVTVLPEGAAIAPWPSVGDRFEEVPGTDGLPARLADAAVRRHLPALDSALARRMTVEQGRPLSPAICGTWRPRSRGTSSVRVRADGWSWTCRPAASWRRWTRGRWR